MKRSPVPGTVLLSWVEKHEHRVYVTDINDPTALARAGEEAVACSSLFRRYGVILESVALGVIPDASGVQDADTSTYP